MIQRNVSSQKSMTQRADIVIRQLGLQIKSGENKSELQKIFFDTIAYPMMEDAYFHQKVQKLGVNDMISKQQELQQKIMNKEINELKVCQCCGMLQQQQPLPFCTGFEELNVGIGARIYFLNVEYHTIIFLLAFLIYSIQAIVTNAIVFSNSENLNTIFHCNNSACGLGVISTATKAKVDSSLSNATAFAQSVVSIVLIILWSLINIYRTNLQKKYEIQTQISRTSATAFTIMIQNFPKYYLTKDSESEILEQFRTIFKKYQVAIGSQHTYAVVKVNVALPLFNQQQQKIKKKARIEKQLNEKLDVFRNWIIYRQSHKDYPIQSRRREEQYEKYLKFFTEKYDKNQIKHPDLEQRNLVFVTMFSSKAKEQILANNSFSLRKLCNNIPKFPIQDVYIYQAPQPEEIIWENVGFKFFSKIIRKLLIYFIAFILICISFGAALGLTYYQQSQNITAVSIAISIVITLIAFAIDYAIYYMSFLEHQFNRTSQQASIAFKIAVSQLCNCIGVPLAISYIVQDKQSIYVQAGLVTTVFYIGVFNLLTPLGRLIDPWNIYLIIRQYYYSKPTARLYIHGQLNLNAQYANYEMDLGYEYGFILKTVIFTAFFLCLQPILAIFAPLALFMMYFVNKYRLFYRFKRPNFFTCQVSYAVDWILNLGPTVFALGQLFILSWANSSGSQRYLQYVGVTISNYVALGVAGALFFFPVKLCYYFLTEPQLPGWTYEQKKALIPTDYDRLNPVTRQKAISEFKAYLQDLEQKQELPLHSQFLKASVIHKMRRNILNSYIKLSNRSLFNDMPMQLSAPIQPEYTNNLDSYNEILKGF